MLCCHVNLPFARKDDVDLFIIDGSRTLDVFTGRARTKECYWASRVIGRLPALHIDQKKTAVAWEREPLPDFCRTPEVDARHEETDIAHISDDIANAMNRALQDRGFSRFVKKHIVGSWQAEDSRIEFSPDGAYRIIGSPGPIRYSPPPEGRWSAGGRMLHLMTESNDRGVRVALVSVGEAELRFHGNDGTLFYIYQRV